MTDKPEKPDVAGLDKIRNKIRNKIRIARLRELVRVIVARDFDKHQFSMSIPARPDHDADLVISWAANELERLLPGDEDD